MHKESIQGKKKLCIIFHIDSKVRSLAWLRLPLLYFPSQPVMQFVLSKNLSEEKRKKAATSKQRERERRGEVTAGLGVCGWGVGCTSMSWQDPGFSTDMPPLRFPRLFHSRTLSYPHFLPSSVRGLRASERGVFPAVLIACILAQRRTFSTPGKEMVERNRRGGEVEIK